MNDDLKSLPLEQIKEFVMLLRDQRNMYLRLWIDSCEAGKLVNETEIIRSLDEKLLEIIEIK